jgi:uncharacterized damage-inducible protein DinB
MFRSIDDFLHAWAPERDSTVRVFRELPGASLGQRVSPAGRTLGFIAWHLTTSLSEMMNQAGVGISGPSEKDPTPAWAKVIAELYENAAGSLAALVAANWTDELLAGEITIFGGKLARRYLLMAVIAHETHRRGQMTVLMRQAGLKVPGVYGPSLEEWALFGTPAQP